MHHRKKSRDFITQEELLIRDRLALGCLDQRLQERLLREINLRLKKAIYLCRIVEATKEQLIILQKKINSNVCVLK